MKWRTIALVASAGAGWTILCLLGTLGPKPVHGDEPEPSGNELQLILLDEATGKTRPVAEGATLPRSAGVVFAVDGGKNDYLYLLQQGSRGLEVLYPPTGLIWMHPGQASRVVPFGPNTRPEDEPETSWNADQSGTAEFILVSAPSPRDVPSDGRVHSLDRFLKPPPYVRGPAAGPAEVVSRVTATWLDSDEGTP